jgi:large repetitive protein
LANDSDPQGNKLATVTKITNLTNGTAVYNASDSIFTYTPTSAFVGKDSFKYLLYCVT